MVRIVASNIKNFAHFKQSRVYLAYERSRTLRRRMGIHDSFNQFMVAGERSSNRFERREHVHGFPNKFGN
jgi:hypothetical protein